MSIEVKEQEYIERLVTTRRVAKTTKGGRNMSFAALVVVGDGNGKVGAGYGKAKEVPAAIAKAVQKAKHNFIDAPKIQGTISHPVQGEDAAGVVFLRPAAPGTGVIAGGPVRAVLEAAGYTDVLTKSLGSSNAINIVHATIDAISKLEKPEAVAARRGKTLEEVAPASLIQHENAGLLTQAPEVAGEKAVADKKGAMADAKAATDKADSKDVKAGA